MQPDPRPTAEIVARAAHWAALLDDATVSAEVREACDRWCRQDPRHRVTLDHMLGLSRRFDGLDGPARQALAIAASHRMTGIKKSAAAALLLILLMAGSWMMAGPLLVPLFPDHRTVLGERRELALADGSALMLDGGSAVNIDLTTRERRITLLRGQVQAGVAPDASRPFSVATADGTATALGTRYIVRKEAGGTRITVVESVVRVCAATGQVACRDLTAGQQALVNPASIVLLADVDPVAAAAWTRGWLEADDMPLVELLGELNRQRLRPIRFDAALLEGRRVTGSFPLDDTDRAARALAAATGLRLGQTPGGDLILSAPH